MISRKLITVIRDDFELDWHGIHGVSHWSRVRVNGLRLAKITGARADVIELFAFLHDSKRISERVDPEHGLRAAEFARSLQGRLIHLDQLGLELLVSACERHSDGFKRADVTIQTCWDADRLDLGRVGVKPDPDYLCTKAAKDPAIIRWAFARSVR